MAHWSDRYVRDFRYVEGQFDCGDMVRLVQKEVFGRDVPIPGHRDYAGTEGIAKVRAMADQCERVKEESFQRTEAPREGDVALLIHRGYPRHVGVYCVIGGEPYVLHAASKRKNVILTKVRGLALQGLAVEGYYRWT